MSLLKNASTVGMYTLLSRIAGFTRDMVLAAKLGAGPLADVFFVAFRLPNFFRTLFAEGAFNAAFVPLFAGKLSAEGKPSAKDFAERVFTFLLLILLGFTILVQITMPWVMQLLAPGFKNNPTQFDLAILLTRITFPYLIFISLVSLLGGVLNSLEKFAAAAAAPILLNLTLIFSILALSSFTETPAHALSYGVMLAGVIQLVWMLIAAARNGILPRLRLPQRDPEVMLLLKRMLPGIVGSGVVQFNLWISTILATMIPSAVSYLYYADRLNQFPLAIIGTAMGTALLPMLSKQIREGKKAEGIYTQNRALEMALFLTLPAAGALAVLAFPIILVIYERGAFSLADAHGTANALMAYAFGLPAFVMVKIFTPGFFATGDTKTPVKTAGFAMILNVLFSLVLMRYLAHVGLALSTTLSAWINISLLAWLLHKRGIFYIDQEFRQRFPRLLLATAIMVGAVWGGYHYVLGHLFDDRLYRNFAMLLLVTGGGTIFLLAVFATKTYNLKELMANLRRRNK